MTDTYTKIKLKCKDCNKTVASFDILSDSLIEPDNIDFWFSHKCKVKKVKL